MTAKPNPLRSIEPSPEAELRRSFAREADLTRELAEVRQAQANARRRYADKHGLIGFPSFETLRKILS